MEELGKKPFAFTDNENASKTVKTFVKKLKYRATTKNKTKNSDLDEHVNSLSEEEAGIFTSKFSLNKRLFVNFYTFDFNFQFNIYIIIVIALLYFNSIF